MPLSLSDSQSRMLVFVEDFAAYHLEIMREGVQEYFDRTDRTLSYVQLNFSELARYFGRNLVDKVAMIGILRSMETRVALKDAGIPMLNLSESDDDRGLGFDVCFKGEGTLAAEYFINELKLDRIGFIGMSHVVEHRRRLAEFKAVADRHRVTLDTCMLEFPRSLNSDHLSQTLKSIINDSDTSAHNELEAFIRKLKKPTAIFCGHDRIAFDCYFSCQKIGIDVPNELSILGVGSRLGAKPKWTNLVSIIEIDHRRLGFEGAKLLDTYFRTGKKPESVRLPPSGIAHNQTTVHRQVSDRFVQKALRMIADDPQIRVSEIAAQLGLKRSTLDARFYGATNTTISKVIEQERFRIAKKLLRDHRYSVQAIAGIAGYPNSRSMRRSFQRFVKMSPHKFREWERLIADHE